MKKVIILVALSSVLFSVLGYTVYKSWHPKPKAKIQEVVVANDEQTSAQVVEIIEDRQIPVEKEIPMDIQEERMQRFIHAMSHQKVESEKKWSFLPLTPERVKRLLEVAKTNKDKYEYGEEYVEILTRWAKKDFEAIQYEHNEIWKLQDGNVGEATGVLTNEEEKEYIEQHFDLEIKDN